MLDHAEIVADHDVGEPHLVLEIEQQVDDLGADRDVERRHRLVADHQLGPAGSGRGRCRSSGAGRRRIRADSGRHGRAASPTLAIMSMTLLLDLGPVGDAVQAQRIGQGAAHGLARIERGVGVLEDHLHRARRRHALAAGKRAGRRGRSGRESAAAAPMMASARVDLPQPDSPTRPRHSPGFTSRLTPSTAFSVLTPPRSALPTVKWTARSSSWSSGSAMVMAPHQPVGRQGRGLGRGPSGRCRSPPGSAD